MRLALDVIEFCSREVPRWNAISVSGYHIREAGATAVQEIGFTLANGIAYVDEAVARGLDVDAIAPQISFFFNAHIDLLEEVAKFRAARRLWGTIMRDRFHAKQAESIVFCSVRKARSRSSNVLYAADSNRSSRTATPSSTSRRRTFVPPMSPAMMRMCVALRCVMRYALCVMRTSTAVAP